MSNFQDLFAYRLSLSTRPFHGRGMSIDRCPICQISKLHCICDLKKTNHANVAFCLLMHDSEILKPSNTGKLIANIFKDTHAFLYNRTNPDSNFLALLDNAKYQPYVIFPKDYATQNQIVLEPTPQSNPLIIDKNKTPLFILLDGTWREAARMFRKTKELHALPMISIAPDILNEEIIDYNNSNYDLRQSKKAGQLATAEVAAKVLLSAGNKNSATHLQHWFEVFCYRYALAKKSIVKHDDLPTKAYLHFLNHSNLKE